MAEHGKGMGAKVAVDGCVQMKVSCWKENVYMEEFSDCINVSWNGLKG